jgi:hypothetical protein
MISQLTISSAPDLCDQRQSFRAVGHAPSVPSTNVSGVTLLGQSSLASVRIMTRLWARGSIPGGGKSFISLPRPDQFRDSSGLLPSPHRRFFLLV